MFVNSFPSASVLVSIFYQKILKYLVKRLEYLASKVVFYECLNSILVFHSDGYYYCSCDKFSGCRNNIGHEGYWYICRFCDHYSSSDLQKIKYEPDKLINFSFALFNDIKLCYEFNKSINFFWKKDYEYRWRMHGETGGIYLKDCHFF